MNITECTADDRCSQVCLAIAASSGCTTASDTNIDDMSKKRDCKTNPISACK
jgi:hypothetical protein